MTREDYENSSWLYKMVFKYSTWSGDNYRKLRDIWEYTVWLIIGLVLLVLMVGLILGPYQYFESRQCDSLQAVGSIHEYHWSFWTGCLVQTGAGYWVDADSPMLKELTGDLGIETGR